MNWLHGGMSDIAVSTLLDTWAKKVLNIKRKSSNT
jgi:hypothetical protein